MTNRITRGSATSVCWTCQSRHGPLKVGAGLCNQLFKTPLKAWRDEQLTASVLHALLQTNSLTPSTDRAQATKLRRDPHWGNWRLTG